MDPREPNLPKWAQELIVMLRERVRSKNAKNNALTELLTMAAKGGHVSASEIVNVIEEYAPWKEKEN